MNAAKVKASFLAQLINWQQSLSALAVADGGETSAN